jgi:alkanesulfonate monooxygenase SsuD/methylene tetrahydromethanopterin reductase-like flavin-dependent oxidoreductase (luciferase family)
MEFYANLPIPLEGDPGEWASAREKEGWHGICASDHLWLGALAYPHVFSILSHMAAATSKIRLTSSFANNLFRSPVEFAQAALTLNWLSKGRFDAGLGAGWIADEMRDTGRDYPDAPTRVSMYREAMTVVRELLRTGTCAFRGEHYQVEIADTPLACLTDPPPPLIGSAGGPRSIREITPLVDRLEVKANSRATRRGQLDMAIFASITRDEIAQAAERVRAIRDDVPMGIFIMIAVGDEVATRPLQNMLGDGFFSRFAGTPNAVGQALHDLEEFGFDRIQLTPMLAGSLDAVLHSLGLGH